MKDLLKCGGCGGQGHRLFHVRKKGESRLGGGGSGGTGTAIETRCMGCGAVSRIEMTPVRLMVTNEGDMGSLCGGWS